MTGVEPATLCLASIRSSQLSYTRIPELFLPHPAAVVNFRDRPMDGFSSTLHGMAPAGGDYRSLLASRGVFPCRGVGPAAVPS